MSEQRRGLGDKPGPDSPDLGPLLVLWLVFVACVVLAIWSGTLAMAGITLVVGIGTGWWTWAKRRAWLARQAPTRRPGEAD